MKQLIFILGFFILIQAVNSQTVVVDTVIQSQAFGFLQDGVGINKTIYGHFDDSFSVPIIFLNKNSKNILEVVDDRHTYIFFKDSPFRIKQQYHGKHNLKDDVLKEDDEIYINYLSDRCSNGVPYEEDRVFIISSGSITMSYFETLEQKEVIIIFNNVIFSEKK